MKGQYQIRSRIWTSRCFPFKKCPKMQNHILLFSMALMTAQVFTCLNFAEMSNAVIRKRTILEKESERASFVHAGKRQSSSLDCTVVSTIDIGISLPLSRGTVNQDCLQNKDGHLFAVLGGGGEGTYGVKLPTLLHVENNTKLAIFKTGCKECRKTPQKHGTCTRLY